MTTCRAALLVSTIGVVLLALVLWHNRGDGGRAEWELRMEADSLRVVADLHRQRADAFAWKSQEAEILLDSMAAVVDSLRARGPVIVTRTQVIHDEIRARSAPLDSLWRLLLPE